MELNQKYVELTFFSLPNHGTLLINRVNINLTKFQTVADVQNKTNPDLQLTNYITN